MSTQSQKKTSFAKKITFIFSLSCMALLCVALISYRLALSYAYVQFSRAELMPPKGFANEVALAANDPILVERGNHLIQLMGCADCHGGRLAGQTLIDTPAARISAPNLTEPESQKDLNRRYAALRLGLDEDHRALWLMPRQALVGLAHSDLVSLLAALSLLKHLPNKLPTNRLNGEGYRALLMKDLTLVDKTVPSTPPGGWPTHPPKEDSLAAGEYLLTAGRCASCHSFQQPSARSATRGQVGLMVQGHDLAIELGVPELTVKPDAEVLYSQLRQDMRIAPLVARLRRGRCPDDKSQQERSTPSRMADWTDREAASALTAWRVRLALGARH